MAYEELRESTDFHGTRRKRRRKRQGGDAASGMTILLDNNTVTDSASVGDLVGNLSVAGGTGVYTFSLTSNPGGLFSIAGSQLKVAAALTAGVDPITVHADNGAGSVVDQNLFVVVTVTPTNFSDPIPFFF